MEMIKNFLKKILPPPVRTFLREIEGLRKLTERLNRDLAQNQKRQLEQTEQLLTAQRQQAEQMAQLLAIQEQQTRQAAALAERNGQMEERLTALEQRLAALDKLDAIRAETGEIKEALAQQKDDLQQAEQQRKALGERVEKFAREAKRKDPFATGLKVSADKKAPQEFVDRTDALLPERFERVIPVVFATNDAYAAYTAVAIESILQNVNANYYYRIYVLNDGLSDYHREGLEQIRRGNLSVRCINVTKRVDALRESFFECSYFTCETYFRFLIPELFPFYDKVIYLDGDLVVQADIAGILPEDMGTDLVAAAVDLTTEKRLVDIRNELGMDPETYVNAGVLVINVKQWLEENTAASCIRKLRETPNEKLLCLDQDVLNMVCKDRIHQMDPSWNLRWYMVYGRLAQEWKEEECKILHFASALKPWSTPGTALSGYFWKYARTSRFYEELLSDGLSK